MHTCSVTITKAWNPSHCNTLHAYKFPAILVNSKTQVIIDNQIYYSNCSRFSMYPTANHNTIPYHTNAMLFKNTHSSYPFIHSSLYMSHPSCHIHITLKILIPSTPSRPTKNIQHTGNIPPNAHQHNR